MENEIKVGEFIRTKDGRIYQVDSSNDEWALSDIFYKVIVKHSTNLIDLIEVGDMVHTKDVLNEEWYWMFDEEMVKATKETIEEGVALIEIVTKEMMESISYKVTKM